MHEYRPSADIWEVNSRLQLDEIIEGEQDSRWVNTEAARGNYSLERFRKILGVDPTRRRLTPPERAYCLFSGHRGCGKSTELRRVRNHLHDPKLYYVVFADAAQELDVNNLRYQDILLHLAGKLAERLMDDSIDIDRVHLATLQAWFSQRVETEESTRQLALETKGGISGAVGLPFIAKAFAQISTAFKTNSTYKTQLRRTLQNYFGEFSAAFNKFIAVAEDAIRTADKGRRILFIIDGTDRLNGDDANAFFVTDVYQLQQVQGLFIYCAPIHLTYETLTIGQNYTSIFHLPMVKIMEQDGSPNADGRKVMREMLFRRISAELFDSGVADDLIKYSGGHPRDLLRLIQNAIKYSEEDRFDAASACAAVREMANDYRRVLGPSDYAVLVAIDSGQQMPPDSEQHRKLLYNLALLEYNDFFQRSHPAVRETEGYRAARAANENAGNG